MLFRGKKTLVNLVGPLLILIFILFEFRSHDEPLANQSNSELTFEPSRAVQNQDLSELSTDGSGEIQHWLNGPTFASVVEGHREVFSVSSPDRRYFLLDFGQYASNPNIIPHPTLKYTWIIVAQQETKRIRGYMWWAELACNATFVSGALKCIDEPIILPIPPTVGLNCNGPLQYFAESVGPHDARLFYGPKVPHVVYGSNSKYTCFGQWVLDMRGLANSGFDQVAGKEFQMPTELQRPGPYRPVEKNWFFFWDKSEQMYAHYSVWPNRVFAQLAYDGTAGQDLAPLAAAKDNKCMAKYMPKVSQELDPIDHAPLESIHQATNSLSITLCKRSEPWCVADNSNTFIFTIFQHKTYIWSHSVYEPYAMLFRRTAPFEIHAISTKPIWIHGRGGPGTGKKPPTLPAENIASWSQTEMFSLTSLSWKDQSQKYHGYIDDVLFIAFGIEDSKSAGIDVVAGDLLLDLGFCHDS
jgi:hypothetical protein